MALTRAELIDRKQAVIADISQARRELARLQPTSEAQRRRAELDAWLNALMAEEHRLRLAIDRAPH